MIDALFITLLALAGGVAYYTIYPLGLLFTGVMLALTGYGLWLGYRYKYQPQPLLMLLAGPLLSTLVHPNPAAYGRLILYLAGAGAVVVGWYHFEASRLKTALTHAAWLSILPLGLMLILGGPYHKNIVGFWLAIFALSAGGPLAIVCVAIMVLISARGAVLAVAAGVMLAAIQKNRRLAWLALGLLPLLILLVFVRPLHSYTRLMMWSNVVNEWYRAPWLGVGPGNFGKIIVEPCPAPPCTTTPEIHAHNTLLSALLEWGAIGAILGLGGLAGLLRFSRPTPWQASLLVALTMQCLVDDIIFWPGPLLLAGLLMGSTLKGQIPYETSNNRSAAQPGAVVVSPGKSGNHE